MKEKTVTNEYEKVRDPKNPKNIVERIIEKREDKGKRFCNEPVIKSKIIQQG